jgi:hypothetical protein
MPQSPNQENEGGGGQQHAQPGYELLSTKAEEKNHIAQHRAQGEQKSPPQGPIPASFDRIWHADRSVSKNLRRVIVPRSQLLAHSGKISHEPLA